LTPNSRSYLNRFLQPDTIIPDQTNPQSWNRFSYTFNNPIRYSDPSGHCPVCIGIAIGIGAVAGAAGGALGYLSANALTGNEFDAKSFAVATVGGGIAGGASVAVAIANPAAAPVTVPLVNGIVAAGQYIVDRKIHGEEVDAGDTLLNFAAGSLTSPIGGTFSSNFLRSSGRQFLMEFGEQTFTQGARRFAQEFIEEQTAEAIKSSVRSYVMNFVTNILNKGLDWIIEKGPVKYKDGLKVE